MVRVRSHTTAEQIERCLQRLPASAIRRKGALIDYSKRANTKLVPKWSEVAPFCACIRMIFEESQGRNILLTAMRAGNTFFASSHSNIGELSRDDTDITAAPLCTMMSQVTNHKNIEVPPSNKPLCFKSFSIRLS